MPEKLPEWIHQTPEETSYALLMWEPDGGCEQEIELTRSEYIKLKQYLALLRGYPLDLKGFQLAAMLLQEAQACADVQAPA